ncbi:MAG: DNA-binding domain-containing protein [Pseudomonadota bacterium]
MPPDGDRSDAPARMTGPEAETAAPWSQDLFAAALLDPERAPPSGLAKSGGGAPTRRFAVYRNNVTTSLSRALADAYPAVKALVGDEFFSAMAVEHIRARPPRSPVMCLFGEAFPDWLAGFPPAASLPYLPGVARLERARLEAYHAADAAPLAPEALDARLSEVSADAMPALRLTPHPSLRVTADAAPALSVWRRALGHDPGAGPLPARAETVLTARPALEVVSHRAPAGAGAFLAALRAGAPLGEAAAEAAAAEPTFEMTADLAALLRLLFSVGGVVAIA